MNNLDITPQQGNPDRLSPEQRKNLLKEAKQAAQERLTPDQRKRLHQDIRSSRAEDAKYANAIAKMITEHTEKDLDQPSWELNPEDFADKSKSGKEKKKKITEDLSEEQAAALRDPEQSRKIYEQTKINEEVDKAIENIRDDKKAA